MDHLWMLSWADRKLEAVKASINSVYEQQPAAFRPDHETVPGETVVRFAQRHISEQSDWPFMIGDTVHALRVSLDYLAWRLVMGPVELSEQRQISFPIAGERTNYSSLVAKCLPRAHPEAQNAIQQMQPDYGPNADSFQPLLWLDTLESIHKHRHLLVSDIGVTSITQMGESEKIRLTFAPISNRPLKARDEVYRYAILDPTHRENDVRIKVTTHVCFEEPGPLFGRKVVRVLEDIRDFVRHVVLHELERYV